MDRRTALKSCLGFFGVLLGVKPVSARQIGVDPAEGRDNSSCVSQVPTSDGFEWKEVAIPEERDGPWMLCVVARHKQYGDGRWRNWSNLLWPQSSDVDFMSIQEPIAKLGLPLDQFRFQFRIKYPFMFKASRKARTRDPRRQKS